MRHPYVPHVNTFAISLRFFIWVSYLINVQQFRQFLRFRNLPGFVRLIKMF